MQSERDVIARKRLEESRGAGGRQNFCALVRSCMLGAYLSLIILTSSVGERSEADWQQQSDPSSMSLFKGPAVKKERFPPSPPIVTNDGSSVIGVMHLRT